MASSILFPSKVGYTQGEPCDFAMNYYCRGCGRCEREYDMRTEREYLMDKIAEKIIFCDEMADLCDEADAIANLIVERISLQHQLDLMMGGVCNG